MHIPFLEIGSSHLVARIRHSAIVTAVARPADALISTGQIYAFAVYTIGCWIHTFIYVDGTVRTGVSGALTVAREIVHSIVTLAIVLAGHVALGIRRAVVDVYLTIQTGVAESAGALWRLLNAITDFRHDN